MSDLTHAAPLSRRFHITGWILSGLVVLFLLMDVAMKFALPQVVIDTTVGLGWPAASARPLGVMLLACTLLYVYPRTAVLGAILLTGYLGGAVATHIRIGSPVFTHILFGVYVGVLAWGGLWFRDRRLQQLIPFRQAG